MFRSHASKERSAMYDVWRAMKRRCHDASDADYHHYGGRGIRVDERWSESFNCFLEDMSPRPKGMTLDRIDNNDGYYKANCRWVSWHEQQRNTRQNVFYELDGLTLCRTDWERRLGISTGAIWHRIRNGWDIRRALTTRNTFTEGT